MYSLASFKKYTASGFAIKKIIKSVIRFSSSDIGIIENTVLLELFPFTFITLHLWML